MDEMGMVSARERPIAIGVVSVLWNNSPSDVRQAKSLTSFQKLLTSSLNKAFVESRP